MTVRQLVELYILRDRFLLAGFVQTADALTDLINDIRGNL